MKIFLNEAINEDDHIYLTKAYQETLESFKEIEEAYEIARKKYNFEKAFLSLLGIMKNAIVSTKGTYFSGHYNGEDKYLFSEYDIRYIMGNSQYNNALKTINNKIKEYKLIKGENPQWASEARKYAKLIDNFIEERKNNPNLY